MTKKQVTEEFIPEDIEETTPLEIVEDWLRTLLKPVLAELLTEILYEEEYEDSPPSGPPQRRYYTRVETCEKLDICKATFHNWCNSDILCYCKKGGRVYVDADILDKDMKEGRVQKYKQKRKPRAKYEEKYGEVHRRWAIKPKKVKIEENKDNDEYDY